MFAAIAFVPMADVRSAFTALLESHFAQENNYVLTDFMNYFEDTWVGRERNPPKFKPPW